VTSTAHTLPELRLSVHAAEHYGKRLKPGLDLAAARADLERLRLVGEITSVAPRWLHAAKPAPHDLPILLSCRATVAGSPPLA
jgi:hypothetical protein